MKKKKLIFIMMLISLNCVGQNTTWDSVYTYWAGVIAAQNYNITKPRQEIIINQSYSYSFADSFLCPDLIPLPIYLSPYKPHFVKLEETNLDSCQFLVKNINQTFIFIHRKKTKILSYLSRFNNNNFLSISLISNKYRKNKIIFPDKKNDLWYLTYDSNEKKIVFKEINSLINLKILTVWSFRPDSTPQINRQNIAKDFFSLPSLSAVIVDSAYSFKILKHFKQNSNINFVQISFSERGEIGKIPKGMLKSEKLELIRVKVENLSDELIEELNKFDGRVKIALTVEKLRKGDCDKLLQLKGLLGVISDDISDLLKENDISEIIRLIEKVKVPELGWYWSLRYKEYSDIPADMRAKFEKIAELVNEKMKKFEGTPPSE
jgi:hypothetical protein